jgi:hypothetical protein
VIVSASYRTDIPAFYGQWFMRRLDAGFCLVMNPYSRQLYRVALTPEHVDAFVFWTKNLGPFLSRLHEVHRRGYPFVVQYSINGYPRALEAAVIDSARSVEHLRQLAAQFGPRTAVWRYDTILDSSLTTFDFHRRNFERLAQALDGAVDEVVISFAQIYRKTRTNLDCAAREFGFTWRDPGDQSKRALAAELAACANANGMRLTVCSQRHLLGPQGVEDARCIDADRLSDVAGRPVVARLKGNRPDCGCCESRDIGDYDTCPQGCVYCYAVQNQDLARERYRRHNPEAETLLPLE